MGGLFTLLLSKLTAIVAWVASLFVQVFKDVYEMLTDLPVWVFDQMLGIVASAIGELDLTALDNYTANTWTSLPGELLNALRYLGVADASIIILTAIGIRLVLQLIPFTRLGS